MLRKIFAKATGKTEQQILNEDLRQAAINGSLGRARKLVRQGAQVDSKDLNGMTPLYYAVDKLHVPLAVYLLEQGADPNNAGETSYGPVLVRAGFAGRHNVVALLLQYKADINMRNYSERTALHEATWHSHKDTVSLLLEKGADPNTTDRMGSTPLRDAVVFNHRTIALDLARHGGDADIEYKYGDSLRKRMEQLGWIDVVQAVDDYKKKVQQQAAAEKAALEKNIASADILQNDIAVKKPITFKPK
jgi:ankyrin repeat protein